MINYIKEILNLKKTAKLTGKFVDDIVNPEIAQQKLSLLYSKLINIFKNSFLILAGITSATLGLKGFLIPNEFIDGGVTGISLIIYNLTSTPISLLLILINIPFLLIGLKKLKTKLIIKSVISIGLLALFVQIIDFPIITDDKLLISAFGGVFLGAGIGLVIRGGATLDGTEILAIILTKKFKISLGDIILIFNIIIFAFAGYFISIEIAMYAILTYVSASKTVDFIIGGVEEFTEITIISDFSEEIRKQLTEELGKGITVFKGKGGYHLNQSELRERDILYSVITRLELSSVLDIISLIDPKAFVVTNSVKEIKGGLVKTKSH